MCIRDSIRPLHAVEGEGALRLLAPNHYVRQQVEQQHSSRIGQILRHLANTAIEVSVDVGSRSQEREVLLGSRERPVPGATGGQARPQWAGTRKQRPIGRWARATRGDERLIGLLPEFQFDNFVEGKSNRVARAASFQVADNPGTAYNPLFVYGGVGLGKTHLMHALGNRIAERHPEARVVYLNSERFVQDMVSALRHNRIDSFKEFYRSVDALLIDDIQFFAGKKGSQEEFFHTFNALLEEQHQIVLSCDRYPNEVEALEERLRSRFGWGLPVQIEPPELETRVAILKQKAESAGVELPDDVAFFMGQRIRSNVRELEGALHKLIAFQHFMDQPIDLALTREALKDLLMVHDRMVSIENIQKVVAQYYNIRVADLVGKRRNRSVARPRQVAMALAKELTRHSLPEIGDAFGGRDHTTVLHACRKVTQLREGDHQLDEDYTLLLRTLST